MTGDDNVESTCTIERSDISLLLVKYLISPEAAAVLATILELLLGELEGLDEKSGDDVWDALELVDDTRELAEEAKAD